MSRQGDIQASLRAVTFVERSYEGDWHALFDMLGIAAGHFNERFVDYARQKLGRTGGTFDDLMAGLAFQQGAGAQSGVLLGTFNPLINDYDFTAEPDLLNGATYTRASQAWDYDFASYAVDAPRLTASGLLYEEARENTVTYNKLNDAALQSTSQTLGSSMTIDGTVSGITLEVVAVGVENSIPYLDWRVSGTRTGSGNLFKNIMETSTITGVSESDQDVISAWVKLQAGTIPGEISMSLFRHYRDGSGDLQAGGGHPITIDGTLVQYSHLGTAPATTEKIVNRGFFVRIPDTVVDADFTVRIGAPKHELSAVEGSPIITTGSAVTRETGLLNIALVDAAYDILIERADLDGVVSKAFADVTTTGSNGYDVPIDMTKPYLRKLRVWPDGYLTSGQKADLIA